MFGSTLLGVAVGLVVLFASTALLCSGVTETVSNLLQLRAQYLLSGLRAMLDTPERTAGGARAAFGGKRQKKALNRRVKNPGRTASAALLVGAALTRTPVGQDHRPLDLTTALFSSPLLTALQSRRVVLGRLRNPQYVSGRTFARALVDLLVPAAPGGQPPVLVTLDQIRQAVQRLPEDQSARRALLVLLARAGDDIGAFETAVGQWYDEQMDKIAGWYKRWARVVLGAVGFAVAVLVNIDAVQVGHSLYVDAPVREAVVATADAGALCHGAQDTDPAACVTKELQDLHAGGLPVGYIGGCGPLPFGPRECWTWSESGPTHWWDVPLKLFGWVVTAFAVSFGAPFWFEALSRLGSLRTGAARPPATS